MSVGVSPLADQRQPVNESLLGRVPLFASLPGSEIHHLAETLRQLEIPAGTLLFREGEHGDRFFVVLEGQIEIIKAMDTPEERVLGVRGPGEYIGEMSLLNRDGLRTASARALTRVQALEMTRADFDALLYRQPTLAYEMVRVLSVRLRESQNRTIRDLQDKNRQLAEAYENLKAAQAQLIEKEKLERELQLALEVQSSLIPRATPRLAGWEFAALWQPARVVSGDYYDFIPLQAGQGAPGWGVVVADVSDKGMQAALFMALSRSIVRASVAHPLSPAECITQANRLICADATGGMFITLFYAELGPTDGRLTYVNAGHNPPLLYRADRDEWSELTRTGVALGMLSMCQLDQRVMQLEPGDFVFLYTDGVTEAANEQGHRFEEDNMRRIVHEHRRATAAEIVSAVEREVSRFIGDNPPFDDVTLVVAKRVS